MVEDFDEFDDFDDEFDDDFEDIDDFEDYDDFEDFDDETLDFDNLDIESKEELDIFDEKPLELDSDYDINAVEVHISTQLTSQKIIQLMDTYPSLKRITCPQSIYNRISPDYIGFYSDKKYKIGDNIDCVLNLPKDYGIIDFKATVSEIDPIYDTEYTAVYTTMTEQARQTLLYYMYIYSRDIS